MELSSHKQEPREPQNSPTQPPRPATAQSLGVRRLTHDATLSPDAPPLLRPFAFPRGRSQSPTSGGSGSPRPVSVTQAGGRRISLVGSGLIELFDEYGADGPSPHGSSGTRSRSQPTAAATSSAHGSSPKTDEEDPADNSFLSGNNSVIRPINEVVESASQMPLHDRFVQPRARTGSLVARTGTIAPPGAARAPSSDGDAERHQSAAPRHLPVLRMLIEAQDGTSAGVALPVDPSPQLQGLTLGGPLLTVTDEDYAPSESDYAQMRLPPPLSLDDPTQPPTAIGSPFAASAPPKPMSDRGSLPTSPARSPQLSAWMPLQSFGGSASLNRSGDGFLTPRTMDSNNSHLIRGSSAPDLQLAANSPVSSVNSPQVPVSPPRVAREHSAPAPRSPQPSSTPPTQFNLPRPGGSVFGRLPVKRRPSGRQGEREDSWASVTESNMSDGSAELQRQNSSLAQSPLLQRFTAPSSISSDPQGGALVSPLAQFSGAIVTLMQVDTQATQVSEVGSATESANRTPRNFSTSSAPAPPGKRASPSMKASHPRQANGSFGSTPQSLELRVDGDSGSMSLTPSTASLTRSMLSRYFGAGPTPDTTSAHGNNTTVAEQQQQQQPDVQARSAPSGVGVPQVGASSRLRRTVQSLGQPQDAHN